MKQWYCHIGNQQYGPVAEEVLQSWVDNGQLRAQDLVWSEGMQEWAAAGTALPHLFRNVAAPQGGGTPYGAQPSYGAPVRPGYAATKPHRGGMVVAFGIMGIVCCIIFGILAWVYGNQDLKEMDAGLMDSSGRGITQAGRILGIISCVVAVAQLFAYIILTATGVLVQQ